MPSSTTFGSCRSGLRSSAIDSGIAPRDAGPVYGHRVAGLFEGGARVMYPAQRFERFYKFASVTIARGVS